MSKRDYIKEVIIEAVPTLLFFIGITLIALGILFFNSLWVYGLISFSLGIIIGLIIETLE